ncbi:alpha/beta fold hydrolase [Bacillus velezensis]|uniref:alpha/beta fold hydrolase n=1 Tax=Bacillus velezensis TaxID=492670 RepID=UPI0015F76ACB|nr:alpha/beta fold hydrolase [Bacillus velezensis]
MQECQEYKHRNTALSKDGVRISYEVSGRGSKAIVLVHGLGCHSSFWAEQVDYFSNHYCVVNIDLAGHGDSGSNRENWTIEAYANDVASVVNALGVTHVIMIGHSLGGPIIVEAEYLVNAHVVGLIAVDSLHNVKPNPLTDEKLEWVVDSFLASEEEVKDMFLSDADSSLIKFVELERKSVSKHILKSSFREMIMYLQTVNSRIRKPLTLINSSSWLPTNMDLAKRHGIHVEFIENVGHYSMLEAPKKLNHQIENTIATYMKNVVKVKTNGVENNMNAKEQEVYQFLRSSLVKELNIEEELIQADIPFVEMGLDSIIGVMWLKNQFTFWHFSTCNQGVQLPNTGEFHQYMLSQMESAKEPSVVHHNDSENQLVTPIESRDDQDREGLEVSSNLMEKTIQCQMLHFYPRLYQSLRKLYRKNWI